MIGRDRDGSAAGIPGTSALVSEATTGRRGPEPGVAPDAVRVASMSGEQLPAAGLQVDVEMLGAAVVIRAAGELDLAGAPRLRRAAERSARDARDLPVVLDLSQVSFIDSTGVRALLDIRELAGGRPVVLLTPSPTVARVLDLTQLRDRFVEIGDLGSVTLSSLSGRES
jgi:anti-sigma B factor antagonist